MNHTHRTQANRLRVAFFNPIIAHYRSGLIRELRTSSLCEFFWYADAADSVNSIPAIDLSGDTNFRRTQCLSLGRLKWQRGTINAAFSNYDTYIFLGSADWLSSWIGAIVARLRGRRVLFWTHGWLRQQDTFAKRIVRNSQYRLAHGLLLYGERARAIGISYGFDPKRLHVMYNSLDFDAQQNLLQSIDEHTVIQMRIDLFGELLTPVVIATARLTKVKRFDLLIQALGVLNRSGKKINLLLVGDGPQRKELEQLAKEEGVNVAFVGACYEEKQLASYFLAANVTVSPGNIGLTCMHSLGYGVPVITHDDANDQMPEWEAIIPNVNGWLFKRNDVEDLARQIDRSTQTSRLETEVRLRSIESLRSRYHPSVQGRQIIDAVLGETHALRSNRPVSESP